MSANFNVQLRINEKTQTRVIRLTDTSTGFTLAKGNFSVTFPDGSTRLKTEWTSPDISSPSAYIDILAVTDNSNNVITGSYKIDFVALDASDTSYSSSKSFDFNWVKPSNSITDLSDVILPQVQFKDNASYSPIGSFTGTPTRVFSTPFPTTSEVAAQPATATSTNTLTPVYTGNYYEGVYAVSNDISCNYTHSSNSWLTISYIELFTKSFSIKKCPNQLELIAKLNTYRGVIEAYKEKSDTQFNILSEQYDLAIALYTHIIARYETSTQDGSEGQLRELLSILEPYSGAYTYQLTKMLPFELAASGANSFNITDGINSDSVGLGTTLLFSSGNTSLVPSVNNNQVTYTPTFGTDSNTFAQGNDSRFHNAVTIGTPNGLSLASQVLSLALATQSAAGAISASDKAKLDGIAAGANVGTVTSVGISAPSAFAVTNSPITGSGVINISATGSPFQYITGAGGLSTFLTDVRAGISLTTTGTSGAATYNSTTGVLNVPQYQGGVTSFNTRTGAITLTSADVTDALTFTPYNATNPSAFIALTALSAGTGISYNNTTGVISSTITQYTDALARLALSLTTTGTSGAATYNSTTGVLNIPQYQGGVTSFNTRTGAITLSSTDVTDALTFTPYNATNPAGYTTNVGTVTSVGGTGTVSGLTLTGSVSTSGNLTLGGTLSLTSGNVTTALGYTPENAANKGVAGGYASLDGGGLVPSTQLPSYVDDVLEYADLASFPASGTTGKIYVDLTTNKIYRWSGTIYVEISSSAGGGGTWGSITGTLSNQTDLQSALNAKQDALIGTGFVKSTAGTISYDTATYYPYPTGTIAQYIRGDGSLATLSIGGTLPLGGTAGQILSKIDATDYNTTWIDNYASQLKHDVKLGATIAKGKAVYVSSANGTNMIVSAASNASESTSSKTLGLLETGGATNDIVKVVTEGLLAGLNTGTANAGDPVWLGTNGDLIFGLANKPVAPAHLVFIGIVTRAQTNNGEIFVKVQNGFEIEELHNVLFTSKTDKDLMYYDNATSLWKNAQLATVLGYTPYDAANPNGYTTNLGTVTSVSASVPTGFAISGSPITSSGTLAITFTAGYSLPTTANQTNWDSAYTNRITSLTTTGSSGASTLSANTLNIPTYTLAGLGGVSGSGTANYIAKWSGSSSITNSLIYDNGTNVGIGTSSPTEKLETSGNIRATSSGTTYFLANRGNNTSQAGFQWQTNGTTNWYNYTEDSSNTLFWYGNGGYRMALTSAGNFGIGTSSPSYLLDVNGNGYFRAKTTINIGGAGGDVLCVDKVSGGNIAFFENGVYGGQIATQSSGYIYFASKNVYPAIVIEPNGKVGIGTSSPSYKLDISGNMFAWNFYAQQSAWTIGTPNDTASITGFGSTGYAGITNTLSFATNATERMRITSGGLVIIGNSASPASSQFSVTTQSAGGVMGLFYDSPANTNFYWYAFSTSLVIESRTGDFASYRNISIQPNGGNVTIGTTTKANVWGLLTLRNTLNASNKMWGVGPDTNNSLTVYNPSNVGVYISDGATSWTANSDINLKDIQGYIENAIDSIMDLKAIKFNWKSDITKNTNIGLIAQEVQKVYPELIDKNSDGYLGVRYTELIPIMIKAIQELKSELDTLKK